MESFLKKKKLFEISDSKGAYLYWPHQTSWGTCTCGRNGDKNKNWEPGLGEQGIAFRINKGKHSTFLSLG